MLLLEKENEERKVAFQFVPRTKKTGQKKSGPEPALSALP